MKARLIPLIVIGVVLSMAFGSLSPAFASSPRPDASALAASSCKVRAYPGWNNSGLNHNKWLDVYPSRLRTDGMFIYFDPLANGWRGVVWQAWGIYGSALRFGVSTSWTWTHPYWTSTIWYYVYYC